MRCFPSGPARTDAGPYKPIGWLLILRCVFLSLTRFSPLHAHRQGHIHIYNTHGNTHTRTHTPCTCNIHRHVTTHTHTSSRRFLPSLLVRSLAAGVLQAQLLRCEAPPFPLEWESGIEVLTKDTLHPCTPRVSPGHLGGMFSPVFTISTFGPSRSSSWWLLSWSLSRSCCGSLLSQTCPGNAHAVMEGGERCSGDLPSCSPPGH